MRVREVAWLRGKRGTDADRAGSSRETLLPGDWFGEGTAFQSNRRLAAALLEMVGTHSPDGLPRGLAMPPASGRGSLRRASPAPANVAEAFRWLDEVLTTDDQAQARRRRITERIKGAINDGGVALVYQPIVELATGRIVGLEALARFDRGSPLKWFRDASDVGMREHLEAAAIRAALEPLPSLPDDIYLALNVSPATLLRPEIQSVLAAASLARIVIEMTEDVMTFDYATISRAVQPLRDAGARVAMDDAGSGLASLRHLLLLHPDIIKIDTSLTRGIHHGKARRALSSALVAFAREIGSVVVAEGIETDAELEAVRDCGVTHGQGFRLAIPMAPPLDLGALATGVVDLVTPRPTGEAVSLGAGVG